MSDINGRDEAPVTERELYAAMTATRSMIVHHLGDLPPEIALQLPNVARCLEEFKRMRFDKVPR